MTRLAFEVMSPSLFQLHTSSSIFYNLASYNVRWYMVLWYNIKIWIECCFPLHRYWQLPFRAFHTLLYATLWWHYARGDPHRWYHNNCHGYHDHQRWFQGANLQWPQRQAYTHLLLHPGSRGGWPCGLHYLQKVRRLWSMGLSGKVTGHQTGLQMKHTAYKILISWQNTWKWTCTLSYLMISSVAFLFVSLLGHNLSWSRTQYTYSQRLLDF